MPRLRANRLGWRAYLGSQLVPSADDLLWLRGFALLFEGSRRAVDAQVAEACRLLGGREDDGSIWDEVARRQAAGTRHRFESLDGLGDAVVRMAARVAYSSRGDGSAESPLVERLRRELDPQGVLL